LGRIDHLGIRQYFFFGNCIGGSFALKLMERGPDRVVAGILSQPIGHRPESPDVMYDLSRDVCAPASRALLAPARSGASHGSMAGLRYRLNPLNKTAIFTHNQSAVTCFIAAIRRVHLGVWQ
jgi:pimeloyl-ACP methyl ester carboxylesterase